ncbi:MAG: DUF2061 domain-containing protein [Candidatus Sabulitectum sp.]|nr:DUF2061 domain-containing protein [Candidatus Sabulitectum sp.]
MRKRKEPRNNLSRSGDQSESKRRTIVKSLLWRFIGVIWTWIGAYIIVLLVPPSRNTAVIIATLIVVYHHSTRMVMYYFYERLWVSISWGRAEAGETMQRREKMLWIAGTIISILLIFFLIVYVTPLIKG